MKTVKRLKEKVPKTGLIIALIVSCLAMGAVYAYWIENMSLNNEFVADTLEATIEETFTQGTAPSGEVTKKVTFKNNGSAAAFLRVAYSETWTNGSDSDKGILSNKVGNRDVAVKNWNWNDWQDGSDGWYYYKKLLQPGENSSQVLDKVTFPEYTGEYECYEGADYQLYFRMELLQASDSPRTLNSDAVNADSSTTVWGKKATVSGTSVAWE